MTPSVLENRMPRAFNHVETVARFWTKVEKTSTCWLWTRPIGPRGYALFWYHNGFQAAHRIAYEWAKGEIQGGLHIDHLCRVRHCVNPDHMEPVTCAENVRRGIGPSGINSRKTKCAQGHEYSGRNVRIAKSGQRECVTCRRASSRRLALAIRDKRNPNRKRKNYSLRPL